MRRIGGEDGFPKVSYSIWILFAVAWGIKSPLSFWRSFEISVAFRRGYSLLGAYSIRIQSHHLLATIALDGEGVIRHIKERSDVHLLELTQDNRERLAEVIVEG
jgi:hypothetical protein